LGIERGRKEVLDNINQRISNGLNETSDFKNKYDIRGTYLVIDYFGDDEKLGTGYNPYPHNNFVIIHGDDFLQRLAPKSVNKDEDEDEDQEK